MYSFNLFNRFYRLVTLTPQKGLNESVFHFRSWHPWGAQFSFRKANPALLKTGLPQSMVILSVQEIDRSDYDWHIEQFTEKRRAKVAALKPTSVIQ